MDGGTMTDVSSNRLAVDHLLEESVDLLREHRAEMAVWLALEVLQLDRVALRDKELVNRLIACQERLEEQLRAKTAARREGGAAH
jgi:hypothetical protein